MTLIHIILTILIIILATWYGWGCSPGRKIGRWEPRMFVQSPWMEEIARGRKTVEGRAGPREKFARMLEQNIEFYNEKTSARRFVTAIRHYNTLDEYLDAEWERAAPHVSSKEEARAAYLAIRDKNGRQVFGTLPQGMNAIEFE